MPQAGRLRSGEIPIDHRFTRGDPHPERRLHVSNSVRSTFSIGPCNGSRVALGIVLLAVLLAALLLDASVHTQALAPAHLAHQAPLRCIERVADRDVNVLMRVVARAVVVDRQLIARHAHLNADVEEGTLMAVPVGVRGLVLSGYPSNERACRAAGLAGTNRRGTCGHRTAIGPRDAERARQRGMTQILRGLRRDEPLGTDEAVADPGAGTIVGTETRRIRTNG